MKISGIELLSPAGDFEKLKTAFAYGADAVYLGGSRFGLRSAASIDNAVLKDAVSYAHDKGKKVYVTVNIFARNFDFAEIKKHLQNLQKIKVDAVIVSDLGVLKIARENTSLAIHISTQANVINKYAAEEYMKLGASRIILARECSLQEITEISRHLKKFNNNANNNSGTAGTYGGICDIEIFVHGAMCMSYSGRCLISNYTTGREANQGECAQSCRWKYAFLEEEKRQGEYFPIFEDANGSYIMNSKELCLIDHLAKIKKAGVSSIKIEGRNKSQYYVAAVTNAYRRALDGQNIGLLELEKTSHRPFTTGFLLGENDHLFTASGGSVSRYEVVAYCLGGSKIIQRNAFRKGCELEILSPFENHNKTFLVSGIKNKSLEEVSNANRANEIYYIDCPYDLKAGDFLRTALPVHAASF